MKLTTPSSFLKYVFHYVPSSSETQCQNNELYHQKIMPQKKKKFITATI